VGKPSELPAEGEKKGSHQLSGGSRFQKKSSTHKLLREEKEKEEKKNKLGKISELKLKEGKGGYTTKGGGGIPSNNGEKLWRERSSNP